MHIGFHLTPFFSPAERSPTQIIDELIQVVRAASGMGYAWVSAPHHWLAHPTAWPQPYPLLARLAPESGSMRLKTSVLLLPLLNPVEVAENIATLDHITHGRLDLGVALDVHFISSLPVIRRSACKAWGDREPVHIVVDEDSTTPVPDGAGDVFG